jgi:3-mercaptopyruvate sulfurtransferase SseA
MTELSRKVIMTKIRSIFALFFLLFITSACTAQTSPTPIPTTIIEIASTPASAVPLTSDDVPRVSLEQAKAALDSGAAIIVDVRSNDAYAAEHIASSISIPLAEIEANPTSVKLEKDQWIITYCT